MSSEQYWKCHLPSFPRRREFRGLKLQHPQIFFKYLGLDSRLRSNDGEGFSKFKFMSDTSIRPPFFRRPLPIQTGRLKS